MARALSAFAPVKVRVLGPHGSEKHAIAAIKRSGMLSGRGVVTSLLDSTTPAGTEAVEARVAWLRDGRCDLSPILLVRRDALHYALPLPGSHYDVSTCGGYGSTSRLDPLRWLSPDGSLFGLRGVADEYISSSCGPEGTTHRGDVYCAFHSDEGLKCLDFRMVTDWFTKGDVGDVKLSRGVTATVDSKGFVTFATTTGPPELGKALKHLDGKSLTEIHDSLGSVIEGVTKGLLP